MSLINDPSMREIVLDFCDESLELFGQLEEHLEVLEDDPTKTEKLEEFGQVIDRVMGAAKSIGAMEIATFCELGKLIGYKSSQTKEVALVEVVVAILFDSVELLRKMVDQIKTGNDNALDKLNTQAFVTRLNWLSDKFKDIERSSCAVEPDRENLSQSSIDDLMSSLGL
ncbi:Hpt domain-containing protein [Halobacteriovorax sp. GB3]|uniref:Hpt domain-containing protein n=1 Tax=Halobacteriovorax sp. GB3 TaxID=2719615 RepID=UPI0023604AA0|nr:Hpt domain-containing protein [Halobacteriovorax sp. GB3]MDD0853346.1 Hpt domain-containing protein [Halobacteriovorax sp. GB3]